MIGGLAMHTKLNCCATEGSYNNSLSKQFYLMHRVVYKESVKARSKHEISMVLSTK